MLDNDFDAKECPYEELRRSGEVHVFRVNLRSDLRDFEVLLSDEETERARRFKFFEDRQAYTVVRGSLRKILGWYLNRDAELLRFEVGAHGKPRLVDGALGIEFNVSHSGDVGLIAVCQGSDVGVDVEKVREDVECEDLAKRFFSKDETVELLEIPEGPLRREAFFRCWTCKEAFVKAVGSGLSMPLKNFRMAYRCSERPGVAWIAPKYRSAEDRWFADCWEPEPGYQGALVVRKEAAEVRFLEFRPGMG